MAQHKRELIETEDGSKTLFIPTMNEQYHSVHGAIQESMHVYIKTGIELLNSLSEIRLLEIGFGTGLNALLTYQWAHENNIKVHYTSLEKYPITFEEYEHLNYGELFTPSLQNQYKTMHDCEWNKAIEISPYFTLEKQALDFKMYKGNTLYNGIYFDAFAPEIQPNLWTVEIFDQYFKALKPKGFLVTYCAKGQVRRNMQAAGFCVERLPGPPGKREMLRATKPNQ